MVRDGDVFKPANNRCLGHLTDGVAPIRFCRVHMQVPTHITTHNQRWQCVLGRSLQLAAVLSQLRRNVFKIQSVVNLLFSCGSDDHIIFQPQQSVFAQRKPTLDRTLPQRNVMHLGTRKVLQRCSIAGARKQPHIHLQVIAQRKAHFVLALCQEFVDQRQGSNVLNRSRNYIGFARRPSHQQIQITDALPPAPQRPSRSNRLDTRKLADQFADAFCMLPRHIDPKPRRILAVILDTFNQLFCKFLSHAWECQKVAALGSLLQRIDIANPQCRVHHGHCLRTHARQSQELQHR